MGSAGPENLSLARDLRRAIDAFVATALGTLGGILVDSGFEVREALLRPLYLLLGPAFDLFSPFPNLQLAVAGVVDRLPVVLIVGLALGLLLRKLRYPRMLLCATAVWPLCVVARRLLAIAFSQDGMAGAGSVLADAVIYALQYPLLILVIRGAHRVAGRRGTSPG